MLTVVALLIAGQHLFAQTGNGMVTRANRWHCVAAKKWECELPTDCRALDPSRVWLLIDFKAGTYQRCDAQGCGTYKAVVSHKGVFTYIQLADQPDVFFKGGMFDFFTEVASIGMASITSTGMCKAQP